MQGWCLVHIVQGGKIWNGRITKQGNKWLRWAMVEAVEPAISSNGELKGYYEKIKRRKGSKVAKVATARRLLCIVYRLLKEENSFKVYKKDDFINRLRKDGEDEMADYYESLEKI
ncbi:MAG: transposase [Ignavibacteriales bacterium]